MELQFTQSWHGLLNNQLKINPRAIFEYNSDDIKHNDSENINK